MNHPIINKNQLRSFNLPLHDNPVDTTVFVIAGDEAFIPLNPKGGVISFGLRIKMAWEDQNLSVILITGYKFYPMDVYLGSRKREQAELRTIK